MNFAEQSPIQCDIIRVIDVKPEVITVDDKEYITYQWFCAEQAIIGDNNAPMCKV